MTHDDTTANLRVKISDFREFVSSILLINVKGRASPIRRELPGSLESTHLSNRDNLSREVGRNLYEAFTGDVKTWLE